MIKATVLIPTTYNDGTPVEAATSASFSFRIHALSPDGHTQRAGSRGEWRDASGLVVTDVLDEYTFALPGWRDVARFIELVDWARAAFRQEARYVEIMGVPEILGSP
jgi:hypothetical protein